MVPTVVEPPTVPSTDQVTAPRFVLNCCVWNGVMVATRGVTGNWALVSPVPVKLTLCGLPLALSLMFKLPVRVPVAVGANTTLAVQLAFGAKLPVNPPPDQ